MTKTTYMKNNQLLTHLNSLKKPISLQTQSVNEATKQAEEILLTLPRQSIKEATHIIQNAVIASLEYEIRKQNNEQVSSNQ